MPIDLIRSRAGAPVPLPSIAAPDAAFAALPRLRELRTVLHDAARFCEACRQAESRQALPPLFFFDATRQAELEHSGPTTAAFPEPYASVLTPKMRREAAAWHALTERMDELRPLLVSTVDVRHAARTIPGLTAAATVLATEHPAARDLVDLLSMLDEEVILAIEPASCSGHRIDVRGVATVDQLRSLLTDLLVGLGIQDRARPKFQIFAPSALREDGTLPIGPSGCTHWLWGQRPATSIAKLDGERVVLLGEAAGLSPIESDNRFPELAAEGRIVSTLSRVEVLGFIISKWTGRPISEPAAPVPASARAA